MVELATSQYGRAEGFGAVLSAIAAGLVAFSPDKYQVVASIAGFIAAALGIVSWTMPK
jgi:hypothetical protein